jgi:isopenicillin-N epimerase
LHAVISEPKDRLPILASHWSLEPGLTFLNHGSYGAVPNVVVKHQEGLRARVERDAVRFYKADLEGLMDGVRDSVGRFVHCPPETIAPMQNATVAIATVLANIAWRAGDEILITDHEYMSGVNELERVAKIHGVRVVRAKVPFPITTSDEVVDSIEQCLTDRTRLVLVSWITSASSLIFPLQEIIAASKRRGARVLVDGTHAPGQIPVDIARSQADFFVGSFHKWVSAPKGTGFLYVPMETQTARGSGEGFRSICMSSRAHKIRADRPLFLRDFDYMGTDDYTGMLCVPRAMEFMAGLVPGGWDGLYQANHDLVMRGRKVVCDAIGVAPPAPESMIGCMASILLPEPPPALQSRPTAYDDALQDILVEKHGIQVPIWRMPSDNARLVRLSAQVYNSIEDYHRLADALVEELRLEHAK